MSELTDVPAVAAYADRIGAKARSLRKLVVREQSGRYSRDVAEIIFAEDGSITAPVGFEPTDAERAAVLAAWPALRWPDYRPLPFAGKHLPERDPRHPWSMRDPGNLAVCWDERRVRILAVEERRAREGGGKDVFIWTHWSDGRWRIAEPPGGLPLFGLETIRDAATIFVHEGPKAAKAVSALIEGDGWRDHPWGRELRGVLDGAAAHVGWMGGALRPGATDWTPLTRRGARIVLVCDNDRPGKDAARTISRELGVTLEAVMFTDEWPDGFDLADPFPADRTKTRLSDLIVPATWATERVETGRRGQPTYATRAPFIAGWRFTVSPPLFFHASQPGQGFTDAALNALVRPFSDVEDTARLIRQRPGAQADGVCFSPGRNPGLIERDGQRLVNMWRPSRVRPLPGSAWPLGRLLVRVFPDRADRREAVRWGATLAARPAVRMLYAVVLRSETQGVGKTTLANVLAALVGPHNVSNPNEAALTEGNFNSHLARKTLIVVDELYSGHSRKTYNKLKSPITDPTIWVNEKYQPEYSIENHAHFLFSSNDLVPIFLEATDRRFFIPRVGERKPTSAFWRAFYDWWGNDGPGIAMRCAAEWVERHRAVEPGASAPVTDAKRELVDNSVSDEMRSVRDAVRDLVERGSGAEGTPLAITLDDFQAWHARLAKERGWRRLNNNRLREALSKGGMFVRFRSDHGRDDRVVVGGRKVAVAANFDPGLGRDAAGAIRGALTTMTNLGLEEAY